MQDAAMATTEVKKHESLKDFLVSPKKPFYKSEKLGSGKPMRHNSLVIMENTSQ
jgi:hypothetical protein